MSRALIERFGRARVCWFGSFASRSILTCQRGYVAMRALLAGRFADAEQLALETLTLGQRLQLESAEGIFGMQMFTLRREQGRLHEVAPIVEMFVQEHSSSSWKPGLALMYTELGLTDKARHSLNELAANEFMDIPQDGVWAASITFLVEVCASLGDSRPSRSALSAAIAVRRLRRRRRGGLALGLLPGFWDSLPPRWAGGRRPKRISTRHWP